MVQGWISIGEYSILADFPLGVCVCGGGGGGSSRKIFTFLEALYVLPPLPSNRNVMKEVA
jgi:hypothetical protein